MQGVNAGSLVDTLFARKSDLRPIRNFSSSLCELVSSSAGVRVAGVGPAVSIHGVNVRP